MHSPLGSRCPLALGTAFRRLRLMCRPNVLGVSCTAGPACRSLSGAAVAATDVRRSDSAICNRRDAVALTRRQAARLPGRSRAVPASHQS